MEIPTNRRPSGPAFHVREAIECLGFTQQAFADALGIPQDRLNEILDGRQSVTLDVALRLADALHTSAELWLNLQRQVDRYDAMHGH